MATNSIPPTVTQSSQTPTVPELLDLLDDLVDWELVAVRLRGMTHDEIEKITAFSHQNVDKSKLYVFSKWLKMCPHPSWDDVVTALVKGKQIALAERVRKEKLVDEIIKISEETKNESKFMFQEKEKEIVDELHKLRDSFNALMDNVLDQMDKMVKNDETSLSKITRKIQIASGADESTVECKTIEELNKTIIAKCSFLDGSILHGILKLHNLPQINDLIQKTEEHMERARKFRSHTLIRHLKDEINEKIKGASQTPLIIKLNNVWDTMKIINVKLLIKYLADNNEVGTKLIKLITSSVEVTLLISKDETVFVKITTEQKKQFIRLIGMFYLQVGENPPIFQEDENMNYTFENGLLEAAKTGHVQAIEFILSIGIDVDHQNNEGKTALLLASEHGHCEAVKSILSAGASVDIQDNNGLTAVMVAKTVDIYQTLVQANANWPHDTDIVTSSEPPLVYASHEGCPHDITSLTVAAESSLDIKKIMIIVPSPEKLEHELKFPEIKEEKIINGLQELRYSFSVILDNALEEIEEMVESNEISFRKLLTKIQIASTNESRNRVAECKTIQDLNKFLIDTCSFLDGTILHRIVALGVPQNNDLISRTEKHTKKAREFRKKASIRRLKDLLNEIIASGNSQTPFIVNLNSIWGEAILDDVTMLIKLLVGTDISTKLIRVRSI